MNLEFHIKKKRAPLYIDKPHDFILVSKIYDFENKTKHFVDELEEKSKGDTKEGEMYEVYHSYIDFVTISLGKKLKRFNTGDFKKFKKSFNYYDLAYTVKKIA